MSLPPHQQRVIDERDELNTKIEKLTVFIAESSIFTSLDRNEQFRLRAQLGAMALYSVILEERIKNFGA